MENDSDRRACEGKIFYWAGRVDRFAIQYLENQMDKANGCGNPPEDEYGEAGDFIEPEELAQVESVAEMGYHQG